MLSKTFESPAVKEDEECGWIRWQSWRTARKLKFGISLHRRNFGNPDEAIVSGLIRIALENLAIIIRVSSLQ
jgi:hypothetical protein